MEEASRGALATSSDAPHQRVHLQAGHMDLTHDVRGLAGGCIIEGISHDGYSTAFYARTNR